MVTRRPAGPPLSTAAAQDPAAFSSTSNGAPPYPTTPPAESAKTASSMYSDDLKNSPAFDLIDVHEARQRTRRDSDVSSHGTWDSDGTENDNEPPSDDVERPKPLNVRPSHQNLGEAKDNHANDELPPSLRPGPANGVIDTKAQESKLYEDEAQANPWQLESNNPFLSKGKQPQQQQQTVYGENSQKIWEKPLNGAPANAPPQPSQDPPPPPQAAPPAPPVEMPTVRSPVDSMAHMSINDRDSIGTAATWETAEVLSVPQQGQHPLPPVTKVPSTESQTFPSTNPWSDPSAPPPPAKEALSPMYPPTQASEIATPLGQPLSDPAQSQHEPVSGLLPSTGHMMDRADPVMAQPPNPSIQTPSQSVNSVPEAPGARDQAQRNEHYQIKHIRWFDSASGKAGMRQSPILTQNLNGPCPLLALVNALVLSTPQDVDTALVETLRTREQVSLGLLIDAVFDELMSGRRGEAAHGLPDVSELYSFLLALHTGMNVNPRFVTPVTTPRGSFDGHPAALQGMHPAQRSQHKPGCFEETREMRLYSTFNIPLIHGWTAPNNTPAYDAFTRSAQTFDEAQHIQFAEERLEGKWRAEGLNFQEQQTLEDIQTLKSFLAAWPTQLTEYGLETISTSLQPGQIAILFRNDHFSTLYKEPRHGALMTLVTDAGYSSHDEIVWESLVDVNGAASEMFSGDFRVVSHGEDARLNQGNSGGINEGWQTVQSRDRYHRPQQPSNSEPATASVSEGVAPPLPGPRPTSQQPDDGIAIPQTEEQRKASEQEDHDLALALQLQEEEEDHQRQVEERRRREQQLSEQFLSNEEQPPAIPPRRSGGRSPRANTTNVPVTGGGPTARRNNGPQGRPAVNRPVDPNNPDAPPTYEQSASDRPYRPAGATAPPSQGNPLNALDALRRQQSAYAEQSSTSVNQIPGSGSPQHSRRRSEIVRQSRLQNQSGGPSAPPYSATPGRVNNAATVKDTDERCVMM